LAWSPDTTSALIASREQGRNVVSGTRWKIRRRALPYVGLVVAGLISPTVAVASYFGNNILRNDNNCGGTCNLKGTRADITAPSNFTIANNSAAPVRVSAEGPNYGVFQTGFIQTNSWTGGDCSPNNNTAPYIHLFWEHVSDSNPNNETCTVYGEAGGERHNFRVQRTVVDSVDWKFWIGGGPSGDWDVGYSTAYQVLAGGELNGTYLSNGNEFIKGTYPFTESSDQWQRTSTVHSASSNDTWTTIQDSACDRLSNFTIGAPPSPFVIEWVGPAAPNCTR
jgi:hypothetical protein